jgi:hypothetical protein
VGGLLRARPTAAVGGIFGRARGPQLIAPPTQRHLVGRNQTLRLSRPHWHRGQHRAAIVCSQLCQRPPPAPLRSPIGPSRHALPLGHKCAVPRDRAVSISVSTRLTTCTNSSAICATSTLHRTSPRTLPIAPGDRRSNENRSENVGEISAD